MDDDLLPDLERLRTLETWAVLYLQRVRVRIVAVERQQRQPALTPTAAPGQPAAGPGRARTPDWGITKTGVGTSAAEVHQGDCWATGRTLRPVTAERARAELAGGAQACAVCRPVEVTLGRITGSAVKLVAGCDAAGVLVLSVQGLVSLAPSKPLVAELDQLQRKLDQGPGLDVARREMGQRAFRIADFTERSRGGPTSCPKPGSGGWAA
ncbi:hypothetical protein GCM10010284_68110 [Streptomyces rubiginosohelvolus]|uniref:DUF6233 domain-containing protein n=1 Tax=Streptomyces rubiginosohelvolus TaxID=67362 RepID=UPI0019B5EDAC|nr:DUF6233 domain-containing protein [Streptomyces rubiginosohelvolus]GGS25688.1 hypothetical protein GCM10010284_68110 [Streptomyces rubiginosohelvolus]